MLPSTSSTGILIVRVVLLTSSATMTSTGMRRRPWCFSARSIISWAIAVLSVSTLDSATLNPAAARKVLARAPPIKILSALSIKFLRMPIFVSILAPPITKVNGGFGLPSLILLRAFISASTSLPA